jgi:hypothetical protein
MSDAFAEFLNESQHTPYPFVDQLAMSAVEGPALSNDVLLDFAAIHRFRHGETKLLAIVGPEADGSLEFPSTPGFTSLYFAFVDGLDLKIFRFAAPTGEPSVDLWSEITDPNYPGILLARARATVGEGLSRLAEDVFLTFTNLFIEPSLSISLYRNQIDLITVIHEEGDDEVVGGDLSVVGGYNMDISVVGDSIRLMPSVGGGTLGRFVGSISPNNESPCKDSLLTINGQPPNDRGEFFISGSKGVEVINLPDEHKIRIRLEPAKNGATVCD